MNITSKDIQQTMRRYSIIGQSPQLIAAIGRALAVAPTPFSVLVVGESGVGKEFFPKIIHDNSPRKHKKYIAVNCGAIPEGTIDSELFGHKKGAFTDAINDRKGYFEEADGGTIFLDEVGEMPLSTQARLLRVLESGEFTRMGENMPRKTDIRIVAATNKDMERAVSEHRFREDLYYRLATVNIAVPALRDRGDDVLLLLRKFLHDSEDDLMADEVRLSDDARQALLDYHWPGNVRELRNVAKQMSLFAAGTVVDGNTLRKNYLRKEGGELVVSGPREVDYAKDREVIFQFLMSLTSRVEKLEQNLASHAIPHLNINEGELIRTPHQLPQHASLDDNNAVWMRHDDSDDNRDKHIHEPIEVEVVGNDNFDDHKNIKTIDEAERELIIEALRRNGGRRKQTAQELQIAERTLYRKIKQYGLQRR